ncbi:MAG TPA: hypothetical protein VKV39_15935 [Candidatus Sulfotelmatobacter sp.]|nr:hypothetical protein [Candidatus Sulfotelmatobacter sp.]
MIRKILLLPLLSASLMWTQEARPSGTTPSPADLAGTTARGRMLEEYDVAASHATDAVEALKADFPSAPLYLAHYHGGKWEVAFGRMSPQGDKFLIVYKASEGATPEQFTAKKIDPPEEDKGFYFEAAKAMATTWKDFGKPSRPYNQYILPTDSGELYVYFLPAQTTSGVYPLGGDVRYTVTQDGGTIVAKRQMHKTIIEKKNDLPAGQTATGGYHTHVLNDDIEDSDVFHVLNRRPSIPEFIGTPDKHVYAIEVDGTIKQQK